MLHCHTFVSIINEKNTNNKNICKLEITKVMLLQSCS